MFKNTLDVKLLGAYRCAKHVSRYIIDHKIKGKMLLVSSNSAYLPQSVFGGYAHYTASKGGVIAMTTELAKELKRYGIMVNTVAPGGMFTPGCMVNGPVRTLPPEKQAELGKEMMVCKARRDSDCRLGCHCSLRYVYAYGRRRDRRMHRRRLRHDAQHHGVPARD